MTNDAVPGSLRCASCGETEALRGKRVDDAIEVTCERCGETWMREPGLVCPKCGRRDLDVRSVPIIERVRGTQMAIQGFRTVRRCPSCDP